MPSPTPRFPLRSLLACTLLAGLSVGCGSFDSASRSVTNLVTPYKVEVIQGNFVSKEQAALLQPGMSRVQISEVLGTPLMASVFHANRWDYVFTLRREGVPPQMRRFTLFFDGDVLARFEGVEGLPSEAEFVSTLASQRKFGKPPVLEASEEVLQKASPPKKAAPADPVVAPNNAPVPTSYPPLEGAAR
ncbi:MAG: outer membrane protein assembly factor BamE [Pseudomonadota bacterium]